MYNHLEAELSGALPEAPTMKTDPNVSESDGESVVSVHEGQNVYKEQSFVRVTGYPAILDYAEIKKMLKNWTRIVEGAAKHDPQFKAAKEANNLRHKIRQGMSKKERDEAIKEIRRLDEIAGDAATDGELPSGEAMSFLAFMIETFYGDALDLIINRDEDYPTISFRANLQRQWLRVALQRLKLSYGGSLPGMKWTMVGHITHNPLASGKAKQANEVFSNSIPDIGEIEGNFRDRIRNMVSAFSDLEAHTVRSTDSIEFHLMPLAVYRETKMAGFDESLLEEVESENVC
jgi:hypothetical protein